MDSQKKIDSYFFSKINKKIVSVCKKIEDIKGIAPEIVVFVIWTVIHFVVSAFHERWFDEAVAWQIAKNATLKDLIFTVPHYEGHPFLWHLVLRPFAKLGAPYSLSLTIVSFIFMGGCVLLFLFKTKFPRIIRLLFPFTYFILYQYGIISRPYCMMAFFMILLGIIHKDRNKNPFRYMLCLLLFCMTSAYGMVIACGISLAWLIEIWKEDIKISTLLKDRRIWSLAVLLLAAIMLAALLIPRPDNYASYKTSQDTNKTGIISSLLYTTIMLPGDALYMNSLNENARLLYYEFSTSELVTGIIMGLCILIITVFFGKRKKTTLYLLVPHFLFAIFSGLVYFSTHHIGVWFLFFVFWIEITYASPDNIDYRIWSKFKELSGSMGGIVVALVLLVIVYQGIASCILDMKKPYAYSKQMAEYLEENGYNQYKIMSPWYSVYPEENGLTPDGKGEPECEFPYMTDADVVNAYLGYNIFYNYNEGEKDTYIRHVTSTMEEAEKYAEKYRAYGYPDLIFEYPDLKFIFKEENMFDKYDAIFCASQNVIWKGMAQPDVRFYLYMRKDLVEELGIKTINKPLFLS